MLINAVIAYLHFFAAFIVVTSILYEWVTFEKNISLVDAKRIQIADLLYGVSALVVLVAGFLRVVYFEKGTDYYLGSLFFQIKIIVFLIVGLLSIYPTVRFLMWRKFTNEGKAPEIDDKECSMILWSLRAEVFGLMIAILAASLMAKGIGYSL